MVECLNCYRSLEYDENGVATCECGYSEKCDIRELLDAADISIDCSGCMGGNREQNYNVFHCRRTDYILKLECKEIKVPYSNAMKDELRTHIKFRKTCKLLVFKKDQFRDWHRTLERPPERLAWPEPLKMVEYEAVRSA